MGEAVYWLIALAGLAVFVVGLRWMWRFGLAVWRASARAAGGIEEQPWQCRRCHTVSPPEAFVCYGCGAAKQDVFM